MSAKDGERPTVSTFKVLLIFRIINAITTRTFFQADEFWQALEPAHLKAFGYGKLTWEWEHGLRSYAFPLLFELTYRLVYLVSSFFRILIDVVTTPMARFLLSRGCSETHVKNLLRISYELPKVLEYHGVIYAPKLVMGFIAAVGEYYTIQLVQKLYLLSLDKSKDIKAFRLSKIKKFALVLTLTNFFNSFIITRTFINSFEMVLTCVALFYWDWTGGECIQGFDFNKSLLIGIFTCLQRPSNAVIWMTLGGFLICRLLQQQKYDRLAYLLLKLFTVFALTVILNCLIDYYFYGELVFPIFRFLKFNFTSPLSNFYGVSPWHFHITQSVPITLGLSTPLFLYGLFAPLSKRKYPSVFIDPMLQIKFVIFAVLLSLSYLPHKEFRFIYPLQPFFTSIASLGLSKLADSYNPRSNLVRESVWVFPFLSIFAAFFLNTFNEAGVVSVTKFLHEIPTIQSVGFIMPCHSTPWQSYLHRNDIKDLWAISCDPPLHLLNDPDAYSKLPHYMDESDYLYENIPSFINNNFPPVCQKNESEDRKSYSHEWPEYLVIFEHLKHGYFASLLKDSPYVEVYRAFNSFSHWDSRRQGDVLVYKILIEN